METKPDTSNYVWNMSQALRLIATAARKGAVARDLAAQMYEDAADKIDALEDALKAAIVMDTASMQDKPQARQLFQNLVNKAGLRIS